MNGEKECRQKTRSRMKGEGNRRSPTFLSFPREQAYERATKRHSAQNDSVRRLFVPTRRFNLKVNRSGDSISFFISRYSFLSSFHTSVFLLILPVPRLAISSVS